MGIPQLLDMPKPVTEKPTPEQYAVGCLQLKQAPEKFVYLVPSRPTTPDSNETRGRTLQT